MEVKKSYAEVKREKRLSNWVAFILLLLFILLVVLCKKEPPTANNENTLKAKISRSVQSGPIFLFR